jgi:hypothetical protein
MATYSRTIIASSEALSGLQLDSQRRLTPVDLGTISGGGDISMNCFEGNVFRVSYSGSGYLYPYNVRDGEIYFFLFESSDDGGQIFWPEGGNIYANSSSISLGSGDSPRLARFLGYNGNLYDLAGGYPTLYNSWS